MEKSNFQGHLKKNICIVTLTHLKAILLRLNLLNQYFPSMNRVTSYGESQYVYI